MEYHLLEKTELWVTGIRMRGVNLTDLALAAAGVLGLEPSEITVVDVRDDLVTFDILRGTVRAEDVVGAGAELLAQLAAVPGVELTGDARIHSDGVLGMIALDPAEAGEVLDRTREMTEAIRTAIAHRAIVYPSGSEVRGGLIQDTNSPFIQHALEQRGFRVHVGPVLEDEEQVVAFALREAANQGYGLVITSGGVGAESKDRTVEGLLRVDPAAAIAWLVKYEKGQGRHEKEGVRIAAGQLGPTTIITLPGPHDEVRTALPVLCRHLEQGPLDKHQLVEDVAAALRATLAAKMEQRHGPDVHPGHRRDP